MAVDLDDYLWAIEYVWNCKHRPSIFGDHWYAKRNVGESRTPLYLHVEIMLRQGGKTPKTPIVDHRNGNTLDARKKNLRWVSHKTNRQNIGGRSFLIPPYDGDLRIPF